VTREVEMKALEYINVGYQRLLTFEVDGGGFDWYGKPPANIILSAYGLLEFSDMAKVYEIDPRVIERTRQWLFKQQKADGSWPMPARTAWSWQGLSGDFIVTSYVAWSLAESGTKGKEVVNAINWMKAHLGEAKDAYAMALAANAFASFDAKSKETEELLAKLDDKKVEDRDTKTVSWRQDGSTAFYAQGEYANVETTALVAYAMMKTPSFANTVNQALAYLVKMKDARGTWGSTSATILALRALLKGMGGQEQKGTADVSFTLNGTKRSIQITPEQSDVMQYIFFRDGEKELAKVGKNEIAIETKGESNAMYQVVARYYVPWKDVKTEETKPLDIEIKYDRTKLTTDDVLVANVTMRYHGKAPTFMICMDLGVPPGFVVDHSSFEKMVTDKRIDKFGTTARQITLYFGTIQPEQVVTFSYELRAKYPIKAKTPKSTAYEYYAPDRKGEAEPVEIEVTEK